MKRSLFVLLLSLWMLSPASAQPPPSLPSQGAKSIEIKDDGTPLHPATHQAAVTTSATLGLLNSLEARHGSAKSIQGTFSQVKSSATFLEETKSAGKFYFERPDHFRTDFNPPDALTNLIVSDAIYIYTPELKQVEIYKFSSAEERDQKLHAMLVGFGFKAQDIIREYEVKSSLDDTGLVKELKAEGLEGKQEMLMMVPRAEFFDTSSFTRLKLWIDKGSLLPQKIWFEDSGKDKTTIMILKIELDKPLPDSIFQDKFPPGTERINKS